MKNTFSKSELNRALVCSLIFFLLGVVSVVAPKICLALFSTNVGSESLSYIYSFNSISLLLISLLIGVGLSKYSPMKFIFWLFVIISVIMAFDVVLLILNTNKVFTSTFLIINTNIIMEAIEFLKWVVAGNIFSSLEAKKIFPYLFSANAFGVLAGSIGLYLFILFPVDFVFIFVCAIAFIICTALINWADRKQMHSVASDNVDTTSFYEFIKFISQSKNWLLILIVPGLACMLFFLSDYQFNVVAQHTFENFEQLVSFYGIYKLVDAALAFFLVSFIFSQTIKKIGVWYTIVFIFAIIAVCFLIQTINFDSLYLSSINRLIIGFFIEILIMMMLLVYKAAKAKYQDALLVFANNVAVMAGMLVAGIISILYLYKWISFSWLIIGAALSAIAACIYCYLIHGKYIGVLVQGLEDEHFTAFSKLTWDQLDDLKDEKYSLANLNLNNKQAVGLYTISLEMPIEVKNLNVVQHFLIILNSLQDSDPNIRMQALHSLRKFKGLEQILPFVKNTLNDDDIYVRGYALITLYHLSDYYSETKCDSIIEKLLELNTGWSTILALKIIYELGLVKYSKLVLTLLNAPEDHIRLNAISAFKQLSTHIPEMTYHKLLPLLSEESTHVANELVKVIVKIGYQDRQIFSEYIFTNDPWIWRNVVALIIEWKMEDEYEHLVRTSINFMLRIYENLQAIEVLMDNKHDVCGVIAQYLILQNEAIFQGVFRVVAKDSRNDQDITNSLLKELRSIDPSVKSAALELLENLGDQRLTKHIINYFILDNNKARLDYARKSWHLEEIDYHQAIDSTLHSKNEWIRACGVYFMYLIKDNQSLNVLRKLIQNETSSLVKEYAEKAVMGFSKEHIDMSNTSLELEFMDIVIFLKSTNLFKQMSLPTLAPVAKFIQQKMYKKGDIVVPTGEKVQGMYIVYSGQLQIYRKCKNTTEVSLGFIDVGGVAGEQSLIEEKASIEKIVASEDSILLMLRKKDFMQLIQLHPEISLGMLNELCRDLRMYQNQIE